MSQTHNEAQGAPDNGLDSLPEKEREETQEILDSLADKDEGKDDPKPKEDPKPEEKKEEEKPKDEDKKSEEDGEGDDKNDSSKRRDPSLMPAYKHKIAEKGWEKEKAELEAKIAEYEKGKSPENKSDDEPDGKPNDESKSDIDVEALADELGADKEAVSKIVEVAEKRAAEKMKPFMLSDTDKQALADLQDLRRQQALEQENQLYSQDFDKDVLPEIKKEYGDDVPESVIADIKSKLKDVAYTNEYAKVPFSEIYRAKSEFRELVAPKRKTAEGSKGGNFQVAGKTVKYEDLGPDQVANLSDDEFDKYSDYMARREKRGV
jgi:hypothetical protein